jgi:gas vesicle protein
MSKDNKGGLFIAGMILGGAIGALTGLIIAPRSGKETRAILRKSADALPELAEDISTTVQRQTYRLSENALRNWDDTLNRLKEAIAAGVEASKLEAQSLKENDNSPNS